MTAAHYYAKQESSGLFVPFQKTFVQQICSKEPEPGRPSTRSFSSFHFPNDQNKNKLKLVENK